MHSLSLLLFPLCSETNENNDIKNRCAVYVLRTIEWNSSQGDGTHCVDSTAVSYREC